VFWHTQSAGKGRWGFIDHRIAVKFVRPTTCLIKTKKEEEGSENWRHDR
jgi:hypothetical protein